MKKLIEETIAWHEIGSHSTSAYRYNLGKAVVGADGNLTIHVDLNFIIPYENLAELKVRIKEQIGGINDVTFEFAYADVILTAEETVRLYQPYMMEAMRGENAGMMKTVAADAFILDGKDLTLFSFGDIVTEALNEKVAPEFERLLSDKFGLQMHIRFSPQKSTQEGTEELAERTAGEQASESALGERSALRENPPESALGERAPEISKDAAKPKKKSPAPPAKKRTGFKPIQGTPVQLSEVTPESGTVVIEGILFKKDHKTIKNDRKLALLFITDKRTSIGVKGFLSNERWEALHHAVEEGDFVRILGEAGWDDFEKETVVTLKSIEKREKRVRQDDSDFKRVELHAHTKMSALDGLTDAEELIRLAASWGHKAIAITDHGVVQAFPEAAKAAQKCKPAIKVIYGLEGYFFDDAQGENGTSDGPIDYKGKQTNHIILLAKTREGLRNLYKLVSLSHIHYFYKRPRIPKSVLDAHREGLLVGAACEAGAVFRSLLEKKDAEALEKIVAYYDYLEIQPLSNNAFLIENGHVKDREELMELNRRIVQLGAQYGKPVVATCDAHYANQEDALYRTILQAGQGYQDAEKDKGLYLRTTEEMLAAFSYLGKKEAHRVVIEAPNCIADQIEEMKPIPEGKFSPKIENSEAILRGRCMERAWAIYGNPLPSEIQDRLDRELSSIINNGYAVMYVSAEMLVQKSLSDGYLVGSRGSVGSSFAATMAGITEVNPLAPHYSCAACKFFEWGDEEKYDCGADMDAKRCPVCGQWLRQDGFHIPFETFLGFKGEKEPDIDLNFAGEYQSVAHKYVEEIFGKENVFRAGTINTIAEKTAYGFVKKYHEERGIPVGKWEEERLVRACVGVKRTTGQHPGGIIIVPDGHEIYEFCPVQRPANAMDADVVTTHFDYHSIDENLLKLDILGHDVPSMIRRLQDLTGVDPLDLPLKDEKVMRIFNGIDGLDIQDPDYPFSHGTYGIPEFGTRFVRQMLDATKPDKFSALIKISGFSHGTDVWLNNARDYIASGLATMDDVISTRDDIMRYLILKGLPNQHAFKIMESVRKGNGVNEEEAQLMRQQGVPDWYIESCRKIKYMFPRAHAVAYVLMSYRIAYYKVYHPLEFYAVYFSAKVNAFDAATIVKGSQAILEKIRDIERKGKNATQKEEDEAAALEVALEMYARGYAFAPARIGRSEALRFIIRDGRVVLPLASLAGLGENAAQAIASEAERKPFISVEDLMGRTKANKTAIEALKEHGALEELPESDQLSLFTI